MTDLLISEIAAAVRAREVTAVDVVTAALARIAAVEPELCAFAEVWGSRRYGGRARSTNGSPRVSSCRSRAFRSR